MTKETIAKAPASRTRRAPTAGRNVLTVRADDKDPNFEYRIVNDTGDRIAEFKERGYEFVSGDVKVGDRRIDAGSSEGSSIRVSVGGGTQGYLMRIRKDWYQEDQAAKQAEVDKTETSLQSGGDYGQVKINQKT